MPTKITETNKKKVTSHHIHVIKPRNLLEAIVDLKSITIITTNYLYSVLSKKG